MARKATRRSNSSVSSSSSAQASVQPSTQATIQSATTATTQPTPSRLPLTQYQPNVPLMAANALVGLSQVTGNLDYDGYVQYITQLGHVRNPSNTPQGVFIPAQPHNSSLLQSLRGDRTDNLTDYRPDQAHWSQDTLPEMIYVFDKPTNWLGKADLKEPPRKTYPICGELVRDIPILPDHISPDLEGWRYEAYCRFDPRIKKDDVVARMPPGAQGEHNSNLSMRVQRFREGANVLGWVAKGGKFTANKLRLQGLLQGAGVPLTNNTTRGITWGANPGGQPIPVPAKLRWESCVEAAPAPAHVVPAVPVAFTALRLPPLGGTGSALVSAPSPAVTGPVSVAPPPFTATTTTFAPIQATNIPVTQAASAHGTQNSVNPSILPSSPSSSSSSQPRPQRSITSALPQNPAVSLVPGNSISNQLLDRQLFQTCPPAQLQAAGGTNTPPPPSQTGCLVESGPSTAMPTITDGRQQMSSSSLPGTQLPPLSPRGPQSVSSSAQDAAGPSLAKPTTTMPKDFKRKHDKDDQEGDPTYAARSTQRPIKQPRRRNLPAASATNRESRGRFRTRWPRTAFSGVTQDMPQSLNEWIVLSNASHIANEASSLNTEQVQPARSSLGHYHPNIYLHDGNGDVVAAPEDFLHPNGADAGRLR